MMLSLAPVHADEGYIPFFPDFLEPDGIGFRGPAENNTVACWSQKSVEEVCGNAPRKGVISKSYGPVLATPFTFEYRAKLFFQKPVLYSNLRRYKFCLIRCRN